MITQKPVCVTGATGFIAAHTIQQLLERGYQVRGTVRDLSNPEKHSFLTSLPGAAERLELFEADLLKEGSFDKAVAGCEYVMHIASPYQVTVKNPQLDLINPAVMGTTNLLHACERARAVKRVVLTSSFSAITDEADSSKIFSEADWAEKASLSRNPYCYSKVLAEKTAWNFISGIKPTFDLIVINPGFVIGPSLGPGLNQSNQTLQDLLNGKYPFTLDMNFAHIDVRDTAKAHILLMEKPDAKGRYVCISEPLTISEMVRILKDAGYGNYKLPGFALSGPVGNFIVRLISYTLPKGAGDIVRTHIGKRLQGDNSKLVEAIGMTFIPMSQTIPETIEDMFKWGHLKRK